MILNTPEGIYKYKLLTIRSALQLEIKGLKFRTSANKSACKLLGIRVGTPRMITLKALNKLIENL
ncbi:hypothetical protein UFOVP1516_36 [uncultured Caudovirales phage]|uniref:Uncharacterized protein n=1 Tax=uncultured Caudovirales phage TaxID=2100421 RepID=A0A6J5PMP0_9CAUD|nr:hypothetical protein UFOVP887_8 [uncultured Caudovirales phage]CAB5226829.1 hypothetical protein UFOVP1516_36 [uncultured Caudovirales phage]